MEYSYTINCSIDKESFPDAVQVKISSTRLGEDPSVGPLSGVEQLRNHLENHLEKIVNSKEAVKGEVIKLCSDNRKLAAKLLCGIIGELERHFTKEDERLQDVAAELKRNLESKDPEKVSLLKAKGLKALLFSQEYSLKAPPKGDGFYNYKLVVTCTEDLKFLCLCHRGITGFIPAFTKGGAISVSFVLFDNEEEEVLRSPSVKGKVLIEIKVGEVVDSGIERTYRKPYIPKCRPSVYISDVFSPGSLYWVQVRVECLDSRTKTEWSNRVNITSPGFWECVWKGSQLC